jgi:predicted tellurium resistance membrane protein TerC
MFELTTESITALVTLTAMETVLGIDNIIFIDDSSDDLHQLDRQA